jgi:uncharacterized membrane protein YbhN (UPF0104 family)
MIGVGTLSAAEQSADRLQAGRQPQQGLARTGLRAWIAALVTAACVILLVANTNLAEVRLAAQQADYGLLGLALGISGLTVVAKALRWRVLYPGWARPTVALAIAGVAAGQVANWAVPFRAGEAIRVGLIASAMPADRGGTGRGLAMSVGVLVAEKLLDGVLLLVTVAVLVLMVGMPGWLSVTALVLALVGCTIGLVLAVRLRRHQPIGLSWTRRRLPARLGAILQDAAGFGDGLSAWLSRGAATRAVSWSLVAWGLGALANFVVLKSVAIDARQTLPATLAVLAALYGAAVVPTLPGRLGVFQYLCIAALAPFGVDFNQALVYSLALYVAVYLPPIGIGLISTLFVGRAVWQHHGR